MTEQTQPTDAELDAVLTAVVGSDGMHADWLREIGRPCARAVLAKWGTPAGAVPLDEARILELAGLAPDRKVCASTCMTAKFEKKPCECYPTSASRSEVVAIARAIEATHGIKGADHA